MLSVSVSLTIYLTVEFIELKDLLRGQIEKRKFGCD
jgi:hypothetical protein